MEKLSLQQLRREYTSGPLRQEELSESPLAFFRHWFNQAEHAALTDSNAMILATCGEDGMPRSRVVLLKEADESGYVFFTNYNSAKGKELEANPKASLLFYWSDLNRQVRIEGKIEKISAQSSDQYFDSRPEKARYGAMASDQSSVIPSRDSLVQRMEALMQQGPPKRPLQWGGYRLVAETYEFWQGRPDRLHDRFFYSRAKDNSWTVDRLAP